MIDTEWLRDFAFRCSRTHRLSADMVQEAISRVQDAADLTQLVGGLAQVCADLTAHAYAHAAVPRPEYFTVGGQFLAELPEDQAARDRTPHYTASQIVIALCNDDRSIAVPLIVAACCGPDRPESYGLKVAGALMAQLHYVCAHFQPSVRTP